MADTGEDYKYKLKLSDLLDSNEKIAVKDEMEANSRIGKRALELMKEDMDKYRSPIEKGTPYKAKKDKSKSNLKESGALHASIKDKPMKLAVELSISGNKNRLKAENHNKYGSDGQIIGRAAATSVPKR